MFPDVEHTFGVPRWRLFARVVAGLFAVALALAIAAPLRAGVPKGPAPLLAAAAALLVMGLASLAGAVRLSRGGVRAGPSGLVPASGAPLAWDDVRGSARVPFQHATRLTGADGATRYVLDDALEDAQVCATWIADAAAFDVPPASARFVLRAVPMKWVWAVLVTATAAFALGAPEVPRFAALFFVPVALFYVWMSLREPVALTIADDGVAVRLLLGTRRFAWDEIRACGFRQVSMRESTWIEAGLECASGWTLFVPAGAAAFVAVAIVRRRLRALGVT
ncbi:MAG: PH domain-containing protein [Candidatus Eisenbacteria bacterium]